MSTPMSEILPESAPTVSVGAEVTLEYTLSTEEEILDSTEVSGPIVVVIGSGKLHPGIEASLMGLKEGETFDRIIDHSLAFGVRDTKLRMTIKREKLPEALRQMGVNDAFEGPGPDGKKRLFRVIQADAESVLVDGNHRLAGQDLQLEGRVVRVRS